METAKKQGLQKLTFCIAGMTCINCQNRVEKALKNTVGVQDAAVDYNTGTASVAYDASETGFDEISAVIESLGYKAVEEPGKNQALNGRAVLRIAGALVIILALVMLIRAFGTSRFATAFPLAREGMGYGMLLVIGLFTSVHCIAMCGGINLSQTLRGNEESSPLSTFYSLLPGILYNVGRLVSYTAIGALVGALGSVITVSGRFQGAVQIIAGIFMVIMGINMLGLFPALRRFVPRLPAKLRKFLASIFANLAKKTNKQKTGRGPLVIGFLNGFMPCGPLQAMQLYALSTGSPIRGGVSMFLFCLGTIPLMFALGAASTALSGNRAFSRRVMQAGALLVTALGIVMLSNGWLLAGFTNPLDKAASFTARPTQTAAGASDISPFVPVIQDGVQLVNSTLLPNRYPAITVQQGVPVRWIINAPPDSINGCNNRMIIREYGIQYTFKQGDNVIEFTPTKTGRFRYSCWMAMLHSTITVLAEGESAADLRPPDTAPKPAGAQIPTDTIAIAQIADNVQRVTIHLGKDGFEPAIVVMQKRLPALWTITIDSLDPGGGRIVFPVYYAIIEAEQGENPLQLVPREDFEFYTADGVFYGYVKVVDDISRVNVEDVKAEAEKFETLVYPEAYFEDAY